MKKKKEITIKCKINKWGSSAAIIIPKPILEVVGKEIGQDIYIKLELKEM